MGAESGQKHSPYSPHSPRQNRGEGELGNEGNAGKDIPVNDLVFVQCQENHVWSRDRPVVKWRGMPRSGRPVCPHSWGWRPADTIAAAHRRAVIVAGSKRPERISAV